MQKTVREWLEELPEPYRSQALENMNNPECHPEPNLEVSSLLDAVGDGFVWSQTKYGYGYWNDMYDKIKAEVHIPLLSNVPTERQTAEALLKEFKEHCTKNYSKMNCISNYAIQDFIKSKYGGL